VNVNERNEIHRGGAATGIATVDAVAVPFPSGPSMVVANAAHDRGSHRAVMSAVPIDTPVVDEF
jgi:hypothetical protein